MSKEMTIIGLGIFVVVVPYLGIPGAWRTALIVLSGLGIALCGFLLRGESLARGDKHNQHPSSFVENSLPHASHDHEGINSLN